MRRDQIDGREWTEDAPGIDGEVAMSSIQFDVPDGILESLQETPDSMSQTVRQLAAAKLVELGKLSTGRAAELAGMERVPFLMLLKDLQVSPGPQTAEEILGDADRA